MKKPTRIRPAWVAGGAAAVLAIGLAAWFALTPSAEERAAERAQEFVAQGRRLAKEGRYGDAMVKFGQALAEEPTNREAAAGKKDAEARLVAGNRPAPTPPPAPPGPDPERAKEAIQKELAQLDADVAALRNGEGYGPARDLLTQAARHHGEDQWTTAIAARLEALRKTVDESFATLKTRATTAKKAGDATGVESAKARIRTWKWPGLADELDLELARTRETAAAPPTPAPVPPTPPPARPTPPAPEATVEVRSPTGFRALPPAGPIGNAISSMTFSPDGKLLLTTDFSNVLRLWDVATRTPKTVVQENFFGRAVSFSPDGRWFASCSGGGELKVWDAARLKARTLAAQDKQFIGIVFGRDSKSLITSSVDGTVRVWDVDTGLQLREMGWHPKGALGLSLSPDGRFVAAGTGDTLLRIWEVATGKEVRKVDVCPGATVLSVSYAPDGKHIACGGTDGALYVVETATGTTRILGRCPKQIHSLAWAPDGRWIATASEDPSLRLWDPATGSVTGFTVLPDGQYWSVTFSPKGDLMAAGSYDWMLHVWEVPHK